MSDVKNPTSPEPEARPRKDTITDDRNPRIAKPNRQTVLLISLAWILCFVSFVADTVLLMETQLYSGIPDGWLMGLIIPKWYQPHRIDLNAVSPQRFREFI